MTTQYSHQPPPGRARRSLLGLRRTPGRLALRVFRTPLYLYRRGWGWMLGRTFMVLVHTGRKSGTRHETVAMVLADDRSTGEVVICSGWGPRADWVLNLRAQPARDVLIGRDQFVPQHRFLTDDQAVAVAAAFQRRHPLRLWVITKILKWGDLRSDEKLRTFVQRHPFVALRPVQGNPNETKTTSERNQDNQ